MSLYCQGKAKTTHARRDELTQTQKDVWDELGNTWLLLPTLYASSDQSRDELDGAFELIEHMEELLGHARKTDPYSPARLHEMAQGKAMKYKALALRKGHHQNTFKDIANIWEDVAKHYTNTADFQTRYRDAQKQASMLKTNIRMQKFGGLRLTLKTMRYSHLYPFLEFTLHTPQIHQLFMELVLFSEISPTREIKSGEYALWSQGLRKFQSDYVEDLKKQWWFGWIIPPDQDMNDKWINRRALVAFTRHFLKLDRQAAFKALDSMALL